MREGITNHEKQGFDAEVFTQSLRQTTCMIKNVGYYAFGPRSLRSQRDSLTTQGNSRQMKRVCWRVRKTPLFICTQAQKSFSINNVDSVRRLGRILRRVMLMKSQNIWLASLPSSRGRRRNHQIRGAFISMVSS